MQNVQDNTDILKHRAHENVENILITHVITVSVTHLEECIQMIGDVQLFQNRIYNLPSVRPVDNLSHLELFVTVAPGLEHANCTSKELCPIKLVKQIEETGN